MERCLLPSGQREFQADEAILNQLKDVKGMIGVVHEKVGSALRALDIVRY